MIHTTCMTCSSTQTAAARGIAELRLGHLRVAEGREALGARDEGDGVPAAEEVAARRRRLRAAQGHRQGRFRRGQ